MRNTAVAVLVLAISIFSIVSGTAGADEDLDNPNWRTFDGTVTAVDVAGSLLKVEGVIEMTFPISAGTKFSQDIYDLKLSDVNVGDYVMVSYLLNPDGQVKTLSVVVEYGKTGGS